MQQMVIYCQSILSQHVSGIFMPIVRRTDCVPLPMAVCPVVAVAMLESRVASCVHCVENVALLIKDARSLEHKRNLCLERKLPSHKRNINKTTGDKLYNRLR